jgi:hypothetical protein
LEVNFDLIPVRGQENIDETGILAGESRERRERLEARSEKGEARREQPLLRKQFSTCLCRQAGPQPQLINNSITDFS